MLRYYQNEAIKAIRINKAAGKSRQLLVHATGTGKTKIFANLYKELKDILPNQQMILVHRDELAKQALDRVRDDNPLLKIGQEAGTIKCDPTSDDIIVASVQTLGREGSDSVKKFNWSKIDKLVTDEAHRSITNSYLNIYNAGNYFSSLEHLPSRLLLGVTATPSRGDGQGLSSVYESIVHTYSLRQAIDDGFLVDVKGIRVNTKISLDKVSTSYGEFNEEELAKVIDTPWRNDLVAKAYIQNCYGRHAIGFAANIEHAKNLADTFKKFGINAEYVYGKDPERQEKIEAFRNGDITVLFNAQLLVEGFDVPLISCVILAAPTKSGVVFSQRVGRGTRLYIGKSDCIILDIVDDSSRHNLVTLPTLLGLPSGIDLKGTSLVEAAKKIEEIQDKLPHIDFSKLQDITKIESWIESVNLFEVKLPTEVETNSQFIWYPNVTGGYKLVLPNGYIAVKQNILDSWDLYGKIDGKGYKGSRATMAEVFAAADNLVFKTSVENINLLKQDAFWHQEPATKKQLIRIKQLYPGKQIPDLTKGMAHKLIGMATKDNKWKFKKKG